MRRLRRCLRGRSADERGAIALITVLLLGGGLLLGCVALTVDLGGLTSQRREIQNAADAVALSTAQSCAASSSCPSSTDAGLVGLAHANDDQSSITRLCGNGPGLASCPSPTGTLADCPTPSQPFAGNYVRSYTQRHTAFSFAPAIGASNGRDQQTCSSAGWGPLGSYSATLPVTFSVCEWQAAVGGDPVAGTGGTYAAPPPYPPYPSSSLQRVIYLAKDSAPCPTFNGHDAPGGFGWLTNGTTCVTQTSTDGWVQADTGNDVPSSCGAQIQTALRTTILIPVYDCMNSTPTMPSNTVTGCASGNGSNLYYHVVGYAAFYVTGWRLSGTTQNSVATGAAPCSGSSRCIAGFFVKKSVSGGSIGPSGTPGFGLTATQLIG